MTEINNKQKNNKTKKQNLYLPIKQLFDIVLSVLSLIVFSPILLIISIIIKLDSKGPVLFKQKRMGLNHNTFQILKFRTMRTDAPNDAPTDELKDPTKWITKSGKILRKTSLDELPQLINVLKGDMSIVGPRPALYNQYKLNKLREQNNIHRIKPGLTGWAQINGRDENNDDEKLYWDKEYLNQYNLMFDIKCIIKTAFLIIKKEGIVEGNQKV